MIRSVACRRDASSNLDADAEAGVEQRCWDGNRPDGGLRINLLTRQIDLESKLTAVSSVVNVGVGLQIQIGEHAGKKIEARDYGPIR